MFALDFIKHTKILTQFAGQLDPSSYFKIGGALYIPNSNIKIKNYKLICMDHVKFKGNYKQQQKKP